VSPLQPIAQIAYILFLGHILMATVIDIDHWRHFYMLIGILWGLIAADRKVFQRRLMDRAAVARNSALLPSAPRSAQSEH
jgi:Ni,Fe-hydrogenase I large subunit